MVQPRNLPVPATARTNRVRHCCTTGVSATRAARNVDGPGGGRSQRVNSSAAGTSSPREVFGKRTR